MLYLDARALSVQVCESPLHREPKAPVGLGKGRNESSPTNEDGRTLYHATQLRWHRTR